MALFEGFEHILRESEPMGPYTWLRLGGAADFFAEPNTVEELTEIVRRAHAEEMPIRVLGGGSNLLVRDSGVRGLVLHLCSPAFCEIKHDGQTIKSGGGIRLRHVIATAVGAGLAGLEQLVGIPGTVGGALHGNAGNQTSDIGHCTTDATVMTRSGEILARQRDDLAFAYRQSSLDELVILDATFQLEEHDPLELTKRMQKLWIVKQADQPVVDQAMGCIFKDPGGASAGGLIEQAGLKGTLVGQAKVSDHNANFFLTASRATSQDVTSLIDLVHDQVADRLGVQLERQIEIW